MRSFQYLERQLKATVEKQEHTDGEILTVHELCLHLCVTLDAKMVVIINVPEVACAIIGV